MNKKFKTAWITVSVLAAVFFVVWGLWCIFIKPVQYALVCENDSLASCKQAEADFSLDSMDKNFFVEQLKMSDGQIINYGPTDCTVLTSGSKCMDSTTGINNTGSDRIIIPLGLRAYEFRW